MAVTIVNRYPALDVESAQTQVREALRRAFAEVGGVTNFHRMLNEKILAAGEKPVTRQAISWWLSEGTFIDERFWRHIEVITDMATTRRHLRPDRYGLAQP